MTNNAPRSVGYRIRHQTEYQYSDNVAVCYNQLRMQPVTAGKVNCKSSVVNITPEPTTQDAHSDYFGNAVLTFSIEAIHDALTVLADSRVEVFPSDITESTPCSNWESLCVFGTQPKFGRLIDEFRYRSPRIEPHLRFKEYAGPSFTAQRGIVEAALDLTRRIHSDFEYNTSATDVQTRTEHAFELRAGVCQDFAHVQIACLRSIGLAARYVSGYLLLEDTTEQEASHAWAEAFVPDLGWVGFDVSNGMSPDDRYVRIATGLDYKEAAPISGVTQGKGAQTLAVAIRVEQLK